jgi:Uma2 family endonuclease
MLAAMVLPGGKLSPDEFLAWERTQAGRHHYAGGEIFAMAGGSPRHNHICARIIAALSAAAEGGPCRVFTSDQRLALPADDFVYADAVVVCGPVELRPGTSDVVSNPSVVVEVLSKSTEAYDRGDKQKGYLALPSLQHLVLVSQREMRVEVYTRQAGGVFRFEVGERGEVRLSAPPVALTMELMYSGVFDLPGD